MSGPLDFDHTGPAAAGGEGEPSPPPVPRGRPQVPTPSFTWVVALAGFLLVAVLGVSLLTRGDGRGARGLEPGSAMPPFAVPLVLSDVEGDANLATGPGQGQAGEVPACSVRGPGVLTSCELWERGPLVLAFFTPERRCVDQLDALQRAADRVDGVEVAAIAIRGDRERLRALVRGHRWRFPVGWDRDGALANAYNVQVCPQLTFARRGGRVGATTFGSLGVGELVARMRALTR